MERLKEIPAVAPRVGKREPVSIRNVFREEARRDRPDGVGDTASLVEDYHHAVVVVGTGVAVGVLFRPQLAFGGPVARAFLQVALDQFAHPFGGH